MIECRLHPYINTPTGKIYINPGTGPVDGSSEEFVNKNIAQLVEDVGIKGITSRRDVPKDYGEGRFAYQLKYGQRDVEVQMPGLPLERVRFLGKKNQDVLTFPRLCVDGDFWLWKYAVDVIKETFENPDEE